MMIYNKLLFFVLTGIAGRDNKLILLLFSGSFLSPAPAGGLQQQFGEDDDEEELPLLEGLIHFFLFSIFVHGISMIFVQITFIFCKKNESSEVFLFSRTIFSSQELVRKIQTRCRSRCCRLTISLYVVCLHSKGLSGLIRFRLV